MEKKSLLELLDEVAKERGFDKFSHATDIGKRYAVEDIIKQAGKRYVKQYLEVAYENSLIRTCDMDGNTIGLIVKTIYEDHYYHEVVKPSITNIEIDV